MRTGPEAKVMAVVLAVAFFAALVWVVKKAVMG